MEGRIEHHDVLSSRQFFLAVKRLADSLSYGMDHSPFLGSGVEYVQSRPYQYGDPIKLIDWRVTARTRKVHVKEYEAPKRMPVYLLVDTSASMTISSHHPSKYETAVFLAGGWHWPVSTGSARSACWAWGARACTCDPACLEIRFSSGCTGCAGFVTTRRLLSGSRLIELSPSLSQRVLVIVLSDMHDPRAVPALKRLAQEHDCAVLQLRDPAEDRLRGVGFVRATEAETGRGLLGPRPGPRLRFGARRGTAQKGWHRLSLDPDRPAVRVESPAVLQTAQLAWPRSRVSAVHNGGSAHLCTCARSGRRSRAPNTPRSATTVGMPAKIEQLVLPGTELEAKPIEDRRTPVVLRIVNSYPHGSAFRYDIVYYGLEPGEFDLKDSVRRKDGSPITDLPSIPVKIEPVLPPGQIEPHRLSLAPSPFLGGYRLLLIAGGLGLGCRLGRDLARRPPQTRPGGNGRDQARDSGRPAPAAGR